MARGSATAGMEVLSDHRYRGEPIFPGAGYVALVPKFAMQMLGQAGNYRM